MTLQSSGVITLSDIVAEHGGPSSGIALSNYYRGAGSKFVHANNTAIPASGAIALSNFYGTSRFGYYWMTPGVYNNGSGLQYGFSNGSTPFGSMLYNFKFKGYNIMWLIWNDYDHVLGFALSAPNLPSGLFSQLYTPTTGWLTGPSYVANFLGFTVWNWTWNGSNPFPTSGQIEIICI